MLIIFGLVTVVYVQYLLYLMHMFQLNTYKNNEQRVWMKKNSAAMNKYTYWVWPSVCFWTGYIQAGRMMLPKAVSLVSFGLVAAMLLLQIYRNHPKQKAKKPLVYTARVQRMLATHALLYVLIVAAIWFLLPAVLHPLLPAFAALLCWPLPWFILFVNWVNKPIQQAINQGFIREAQNKIKDMPNLTVVGITGSYGKTSVKFFLTELLKSKYNVLCTPRNFNTDLGVTITVRQDLQPYHDVFVCEMGARYVKDIKTICDIVHPKYGVITAIGPQHLETFGGMENIVKTKFELYDALPADGMAFLNYDNELIYENRGDKPQVGFGESENADVRLMDMQLGIHGTDFTVKIDGKDVAFHTELIGYHNILDITAAIAVAHELKVPEADLVRRVKRLKPVEHRLQLLPRNGRLSIIDDAYNSNPVGFKGAVDTLERFPATRVLVTPGMIELGPKQYELNKEAANYASSRCDYIILVGKKQTEPLLEGVQANPDFDQSHLFQVDSLNEAWKIIPGIPGNELVVLLENDLPDNY